MTANNLGRINNFIPGPQGVTAGGQGNLNMPTNLRAHRVNFQCSGICYQNPVAKLATGDTGTGTFTLTVVAGVITAIAIATTNSTKGAGTYPLTITDTPVVINGVSFTVGQGATGTYTVNGANVITAAAITLGGVVAPVPPSIFFTSFQQLVNGKPKRDISPAHIMAIAQANLGANWVPQNGEFPVFYTEPWRNMNVHNEVNSWDLAGQGTWQFKFGITSQITSPSLAGSYEFDYMRNTRPAQAADVAAKVLNINNVACSLGDPVPFLQPVEQHEFQIPVPSGRYPITVLPWDFPIARLWLSETGAGSIYQLEVWQDGNKILEAVQAQFNQILNEYGFNTTIFDAAFVSDPDQRLWKALKCTKSFQVVVYSQAATTLTIVEETLPGSF